MTHVIEGWYLFIDTEIAVREALVSENMVCV